jgi:hypothetical protein
MFFFQYKHLGKNKLFNQVTLFYTTVAFCGLVVRIPGYRSGAPGSVPGATRFLRSSGSGMGSTEPHKYN